MYWELVAININLDITHYKNVPKSSLRMVGLLKFYAMRRQEAH